MVGNASLQRQTFLLKRFCDSPTSTAVSLVCFSPPPPASLFIFFLAKLMEEKCDFQRSMANNEAKLKENEQDLKAAQRGFVEDLEKINTSYSRNRCKR